MCRDNSTRNNKASVGLVASYIYLSGYDKWTREGALCHDARVLVPDKSSRCQ